MSNQYGSFVKRDYIVAAMDYYKHANVKFTNGKKLAAALNISTHKAGHIIRLLGFKPWTDAKSTNCKRCYVVPKESRQRLRCGTCRYLISYDKKTFCRNVDAYTLTSRYRRKSNFACKLWGRKQ